MSRGTKDLIRTAAPSSNRQQPPPDLQPQPPTTGIPRPVGSAAPATNVSSANTAGPSTSDLVSQLKTKLDVQRRELDDRTDNVNAIQRNFQRLSEMYAGDRTRISQLEEENAKMAIELESLRAEKKLFVAVKTEFIVLQKALADERETSAETIATLKAHLAQEQRKTLEALSEAALLRHTVEVAGQQSSDVADMFARLGGVVGRVEVALTALFAELLGTQQATGLVKPILGAGISAVDVTNTARLDPETRLGVVVKAIAHCTSHGFAPIRRVVDELANRHLGTLDEAGQAHAAEVARLQAAEVTALAKAKDLDERLRDANEKLREAHKIWSLERSTLQDKLAAQKSEFDARIIALENALKGLEGNVKQTGSRASEIETELQAARNEIQRLQGDLREMKAMRDAATANANEGVSSLTRNISDMAAELARERDLSAVLRRDVDKMRGLLEEEVARGRLSKREHDDAMTRVVADRDRARATTEAAEVHIVELRKTVAGLEEQLQALSQDKSSLATLLARTLQLERDVERLTHELNVKTSEALNFKMTVEDLELERVKLQTELEEMRRLAARHDGGADRLQGLEKALAAETAARKKLDGELEALKVSFRAATEEARHAKEAEQRASALHLAASAEVGSIQRELAGTKSAAAMAVEGKSAADAKCDALQRRLNSAEMEAGESRSALQRLTELQDDSKVRNQDLTKKMMQVQTWADEIKALQTESIKTVKKVLAAEEACESGYSCASCLEVMKNPVVCAPCGHAYCRSCFTDANKTSSGAKGTSFCPECQDGCVTHVMPSKNLDLLAGKFEFRKRALKELTAMLEKTYAGLEARQT